MIFKLLFELHSQVMFLILFLPLHYLCGHIAVFLGPYQPPPTVCLWNSLCLCIQIQT